MASRKLRRFTNGLVLFLLSGGILTAAWADPSLPHLISDHAVFQQGRKIHVWGTAEPGEQITVRLAEHETATRADSAGHWSVELPAMQAGGPFTLNVAGKTTLVVKDILIGEVWVA